MILTLVTIVIYALLIFMHFAIYWWCNVILSQENKAMIIFSFISVDLLLQLICIKINGNLHNPITYTFKLGSIVHTLWILAIINLNLF